MRKIENFSFDYHGQKVLVEVGKLAHQANGSLTVRYGDTEVLVTVVSPKKKRNDDINFLPLTVDYEEKMYAAGKISGSRFIKREGRPSEEAILTSRLIDRPLRPLFPKGYYFDVQVIITVLSYDQDNDSRIPSLLGTSLALGISDIPWNGPVGIGIVGLIDEKLVFNPTESEMEKSDLDLTVISTEERVVMIEAGAKQVEEKKVLEAIEFAHNKIKDSIKFQKDIIKKIGKEKRAFEVEKDEELYKMIEKTYSPELDKILDVEDKLERELVINETIDRIVEEFKDDEEKMTKAKDYFIDIYKGKVRSNVLEKEKRLDGRKIDEVREISCSVGLLPRVHGSGLFNRGYTQILNITTLGSPGMKQLIDTMEEDTSKRYMHHYNFPPFSVGEARPIRSAGRREIGHGALAEKALVPVLPSEEDFPYTIRLVSEALSSDGSTSMGSTCASTLSLMDAGVPITDPVSGIAMGLIDGGNGEYKILTDIAGVEDGHGDMDFKIAGSKKGITAIQLDVKNNGLTLEMIKQTFEKGGKGRLHILDKMLKAISKPREDLSEFAPRIETVIINPDKIRDIIGPGGKVINGIIEETGVDIDIEDDGRVMISSPDKKSILRAKEMIKILVEEPEVGKIYEGEITKILDFGAFAQILPGKEGLIHVSEISEKRVEKVSNELKVGQKVKVRLINIDDMGRLNLSMKQTGKK